MSDHPIAALAATDRSRDVSQPLEKLSPAETVKANSRYLRGTIADGLADRVTGAVAVTDTQLLKFHGIYQQDDRDLRDERRHQKLEPAYEFMARLRLPGGVCQPWQWLKLDEIARTFANGTLRLTTRQTFQLHGVLKPRLKATLQAINAALLDTLGACGDDNRGVLCSPRRSPQHDTLFELAHAVSQHLLPHTNAYREIWLDGEPVAVGTEEEPLYGATYLPRKFKIAFALPPINDVDLFANDLGFIALLDGQTLTGFNIAVGGGMGRTDHEPATYPRLADVIGSCAPERVVEVAEQVVAIQRDYGDRVERKHARFKYTLDDRGLPWFKAELERRLGWPLAAPGPAHFAAEGDLFGWDTVGDGSADYTLFVENGRVQGHQLDGLREIARLHDGDFRLTPNQNLIIAGIEPAARRDLAALLKAHRLDVKSGPLRRHALACVGLPTCGLAMAESERYLPDLITRLEALAADCGLADTPISVRMSGCPNGCSRPYLAEIGLTGRGPGTYNVYLGGGENGQRLNCLFLDNAHEAKILAELAPLLKHYAAERQLDEAFGDFVIRAGYVREIRAGRDFNG